MGKIKVICLLIVSVFLVVTPAWFYGIRDIISLQNYMFYIIYIYINFISIIIIYFIFILSNNNQNWRNCCVAI